MFGCLRWSCTALSRFVPPRRRFQILQDRDFVPVRIELEHPGKDCHVLRAKQTLLTQDTCLVVIPHMYESPNCLERKEWQIR